MPPQPSARPPFPPTNPLQNNHHHHNSNNNKLGIRHHSNNNRPLIIPTRDMCTNLIAMERVGTCARIPSKIKGTSEEVALREREEV